MRGAVEQLRQSEYKSSMDFKITAASYLKWEPDDSRSLLLCAFLDSGKMVSTMEMLIVSSRLEAEDYVGAKLDLECFASFAVLKKAATDSCVRGLGLNSLLRLYFLDAAVKAGVRYIVGGVYDGAPRTRLMEKMGYTFRAIPRPGPKDSDGRPFIYYSSRMIAILDLEKYCRLATDVLLDALGTLPNQFPLRGSLLK